MNNRGSILFAIGILVGTVITVLGIFLGRFIAS